MGAGQEEAVAEDHHEEKQVCCGRAQVSFFSLPFAGTAKRLVGGKEAVRD